ncbi:outer membrane beta-barrel protein [Phaeodactylibacter luteus]|uniref:PorT family protein n=1 Tax=Phaeodactylibacter luteus TaxID=1564516 RepID=A0A5C6RUT2_9BACT|nr:outer membrane beta-barrel protein [Phaeodactylibacter luteus]TXB66276.1 PorT family protein [Phaeodactylibacter luteus]
MKQFLLTTTILLAFAVFLRAQAPELPDRRFEAGLVAGLNLSQIDGDKLRGFYKFGFQGGLKADAILTERWKVGIEILFSQQGAKRSKFDGLDSEFDIEEIHFNMVEAPLLVHFRDWKLQVTAGGSYGRIMDYSVTEVTGEDGTATHELSEDIFSVILGGSFYFTDNIVLDVRWSRWLGSPYSDAQAEANPQTLVPWIGRTVTVRGCYLF